jgi:hypothetical protein
VANRFDFGASGRGYEGVDLGEVASVEDDAGGVANVNVGELVDYNPALAALLAGAPMVLVHVALPRSPPIRGVFAVGRPRFHD